METYSQYIVEASDLNKKTRILLLKFGFKTFKGLARLKAFTLIRKLGNHASPKLLTDVEAAISRRGVNFVKDDTIRSMLGMSHRRLGSLWKKMIYRFSDLKKYKTHEIIDLLGGGRSSLFRSKGIIPWFHMNGLAYDMRTHEFFALGFSEKVVEKLVIWEVSGLKVLSGKTDNELLDILTQLPTVKKDKIYSKDDVRLHRPSKMTSARLREIKYILWRHGIHRPCMPI